MLIAVGDCTGVAGAAAVVSLLVYVGCCTGGDPTFDGNCDSIHVVVLVSLTGREGEMFRGGVFAATVLAGGWAGSRPTSTFTGDVLFCGDEANRLSDGGDMATPVLIDRGASSTGFAATESFARAQWRRRRGDIYLHRAGS